MTIKTTRPHNHEVAKEILHKERAKVNQTDIENAEKGEENIEVGNEKKIDVDVVDVEEANEKEDVDEKGEKGKTVDKAAGSDDIKGEEHQERR